MPTEQKTIRKLRAILSADVKGYSLLMADNELETIATLKSYRQKMTSLIRQHQGRVVDSPGDNILAEFASAVDAVSCAVKIQEELKERNAELSEDRKMQFRIGINIGDVVQDADRIYGDGVNVAARIEGLAEPGGICISRGVCDHVKKKLKLGFEYLGEHAVKNISEPVRVYNSLFNDLALDPVHNKIYITDMAGPENPAMVIVDMETGKSRRVLEGHKSVVPEALPIVIGDKTMSVDENGKGKPTIGLDPITIDPESEWVYYGPSQGTSLWRIRAADLADESLSNDELATRIERYGDRPICDGITMDGEGNVYVTDLTGYAVGVIEPSGKYRVLHRDEKLLVWPDGMSYGPDNYIYVVTNQLHLSPVFNMGKDLSTLPYYLVRFKSLAKGAVGR